MQCNSNNYYRDSDDNDDTTATTTTNSGSGRVVVVVAVSLAAKTMTNDSTVSVFTTVSNKNMWMRNLNKAWSRLNLILEYKIMLSVCI